MCWVYMREGWQGGGGRGRRHPLAATWWKNLRQVEASILNNSFLLLRFGYTRVYEADELVVE